MDGYVNVFFIFIGILVIFYIYAKVKKKLFSEKESILWLFLGVSILLLSIYPKTIDKISEILGIAYPPSLLFLLCIIFLLIISIRQSQQLSVLNEKIKELAQHIAIINEKTKNDN